MKHIHYPLIISRAVINPTGGGGGGGDCAHNNIGPKNHFTMRTSKETSLDALSIL